LDEKPKFYIPLEPSKYMQVSEFGPLLDIKLNSFLMAYQYIFNILQKNTLNSDKE
jgi:hypothetical protein